MGMGASPRLGKILSAWRVTLSKKFGEQNGRAYGLRTKVWVTFGSKLGDGVKFESDVRTIRFSVESITLSIQGQACPQLVRSGGAGGEGLGLGVRVRDEGRGRGAGRWRRGFDLIRRVKANLLLFRRPLSSLRKGISLSLIRSVWLPPPPRGNRKAQSAHHLVAQLPGNIFFFYSGGTQQKKVKHGSNDGFLWRVRARRVGEREAPSGLGRLEGRQDAVGAARVVRPSCPAAEPADGAAPPIRGVPCRGGARGAS